MNYPTPSRGNVNCRCGELNTPGCARCNRCALRCGCGCQRCGNCRQFHARTGMCRVCGLCKRATTIEGEKRGYRRCSCRMRPKYVTLEKEAPRDALKRYRTQRLRRPIGLELELSDIGTNARNIVYNAPVGAQWVHDGSITAGGQELVVMPMAGDHLVMCVDYFAKQFRTTQCAVDNSCGYHVHVGAAEFGGYELRRLLLLYHRFEDLFYSLVEDGRDKNKMVRGEAKCYCKRLKWGAKWYEALMTLTRPGEIRGFIIKSLYPHAVQPQLVTQVKKGMEVIKRTRVKIDMRTIRKHKYEQCRYYGLNLHTWFERGTAEYRHHEGTIDRDTILNWALFCGWFTELASVLTDAQVAQIITLEQLLLTQWSTGAGTVGFPSEVSAWVYRTLAARKAKRG
jgi:hypothetical protein